MLLNDYQKAANATANYPSAEYPFFCLQEEFSELDVAYHDYTKNPSDHQLDLVMKEAGDCMWEVAECCTQLGVKLGALEAIGGFTVPSGTMIGMHRETGEVASVITKGMRKLKVTSANFVDNLAAAPGVCPQRDQLLVHLAKFLMELAMFCDMQFDGGLEQVMTANIEKLQGRVQRGTICGEGDLR